MLFLNFFIFFIFNAEQVPHEPLSCFSKERRLNMASKTCSFVCLLFNSFFPKENLISFMAGADFTFYFLSFFFFYSKSSESFQILQDSFSWLIQWGSQASFSWKHLGVCLTIMEILCGETSNLRWLRRRLPSLQKDLKMSSWIICFLISPDCPLSQWKQI